MFIWHFTVHFLSRRWGYGQVGEKYVVGGRAGEGKGNASTGV
ncbi:hypothetical protein CLOBOL_00470 [Enterocloster bolteae ATCC BAA-613]|uniref:Uncharacterized protein n=1 Tax=Enterocloster bolteae (strain ATCC BAA-613 / DSM 15670 / CCUG 46953 / JCM 12243 / WAL 16351) TaxID=411902 RepID=A8RHP6_ENTBW|nr:hypothetical protein CLOBOL_00470 [Enterocloster bolteae ATCC BAA-613]